MEVIKEFNDWSVYEEGIEYKGHYFIAYDRFGEQDWLVHLREKNWFTHDVESDYCRAKSFLTVKKSTESFLAEHKK